MTAEKIIEKLKLIQHPEGGFYRETYRGDKSITLDGGKVRSTGTAIFYMLSGADKSHFHKVASDELWFFHQGEPIEILVINEGGHVDRFILGNRLDLNQQPQILVKSNMWFAAHIPSATGYSLVSCVVAPGFDFADFELANKDELLKMYPNLTEEIEMFGM